MRNVLKKTLLGTIFISGLIGMLLLLSFIFLPKNNGNKSGIMDPAANGILSEPSDTIDVLIVGDSEAYSSFIPKQIWAEHGITSYCCSTPAQLLSYSEQFVHKAFRQQNPKMVILETNTIFRPVKLNNVMLNRLESIFPVFTYHNRWKSLNAEDFGTTVNYTNIENTKGYRFSDAVAEADVSNYMKASSKYEYVPSGNRFYVERIKDYCEKNGAVFLLVSTPSTKNWNSKKHNAINKMSKELGVKYIDMNTLKEEVPINWKTDTRDRGDHMNNSGARKVTAYLGNYLANSGMFVDHRSDNRYSPWNNN